MKNNANFALSLVRFRSKITMAMPQTFKKQERLCSFTAINDLVKNGDVLFHYPFRVVYKLSCIPTELIDINCVVRAITTDGEQIVSENSLENDHTVCIESSDTNHDLCNKILVSVPKKNFKRAVKRNLLKRRIRESYRKNKILLQLPQDTTVNFMLVYVSKDLLEYSYIERKLKEVLEKISKEADREILEKTSKPAGLDVFGKNLKETDSQNEK